MKRYKWNLGLEREKGEDFSGALDKLFAKRDIKKSGEGMTDLIDPYTMKDMDKAVIKLGQHLGSRVLVFGDYDADGITSTVMLYSFLKDKIGVNVDFMIPDRLIEGYGLKDIHVDRIIGIYDLVITVDSGITSVDEVKKLKDNGVDVIITDHHLPKDKLPLADAILNPQRADSTYAYRDLAGAGVALKFIAAISNEFGDGVSWLDYIDLAALGTIGDVMPLTGENRVIVQKGLERLKNSRNPGLQALAMTALKDRGFDSVSMSFYLIPVINASSRLGEIDLMLDLLLSQDREVIRTNLYKLMDLNENRKLQTATLTEEAINKTLEYYDFTGFAPIVVFDKDWHKGLIGIIASKLVDRFERPSIVFTQNEDGTLSGSMRSYGEISAIELLNKTKMYIEHYGGHAGAAGMTIKKENLEKFRSALKSVTMNHEIKDFQPEMLVDMIIAIPEITIESIAESKEYEPFGQANPEPRFLILGLEVKQAFKMGKKPGAVDAHMRMVLADRSGRTITAIGFFNSYFVDKFPVGESVAVVVRLGVNRGKPQLFVEDMKTTKRNDLEDNLIEVNNEYEESHSFIEDIVYRYKDINQDDLIPNKKDILAVINFLNKSGGDFFDIDLLVKSISKNHTKKLNSFLIFRVLEILNETGNIEYYKISERLVYASKFTRDSLMTVSQTKAHRKLVKTFRL